MTAEKYALEMLKAFSQDEEARSRVIDALGDFLAEAYSIIGQNVPRKTRLERIEAARRTLAVRLEMLLN